MRLKLGPLPTFVTIPENDLETVLLNLKRLDESLFNQPVVQEHRDHSQEILDTLKMLISEDDEMFVINSRVPYRNADSTEGSIEKDNSNGEPDSTSATVEFTQHLSSSNFQESPIHPSDSGFSSPPNSVDSRSSTTHSAPLEGSTTVCSRSNLFASAKKLNFSLELQRFKRRNVVMETLREVGFKDVEVPPMKVKEPVEVQVPYLRGMEMIGKVQPEGASDVKIGLSDRHRLVSVSLVHDENKVFPHEHKPAYFLSHFSERKRRPTGTVT